MNFSPGGVGASDCLTTVVVGVELGRPRPPLRCFRTGTGRRPALGLPSVVAHWPPTCALL